MSMNLDGRDEDILVAKPLMNSLITVRSRPSSSTLASSMFSTTRGRRPCPTRRMRLRGLKRPPRSLSSQKVLVIPEKSKETSGATYSMSKATICCFRMRRWPIRNSWPSAGDLFETWVLAW